jgi:hypothetical protein
LLTQKYLVLTLHVVVYGFIYKGALQFNENKWRCGQSKNITYISTTTNNNGTTTTTPVTLQLQPNQIIYKIMTSFTISPSISAYINHDMPTIIQIQDFVHELYKDNVGVRPGAGLYTLSVAVKEQLLKLTTTNNNTNVFSTYSNITIE